MIEEDGDENKLSPPSHKNNNANLNVNKNKYRSSSHDEFGVATRKIFQNKIKMKRVEDLDCNTNYGSAQKSGGNQNGRPLAKYSDEGDTNINFAEQYRMNLRRTVFNETKMMIKSKRTKLKYSYQTLD